MKPYSGVVTNSAELAALSPEKQARNFAKVCRAKYFYYRHPCTHRGFNIGTTAGIPVPGLKFVTTKGRKAYLEYNNVKTDHTFDLNNIDDYPRLYCAIAEYID